MLTRLLSACFVSVCLNLSTPTAQRPTPGPQVADPGGQLTVDAFALETVNAGAPVKDAPYSAEATTEIIQTFTDGNRIVRKTTASLYRDSRGRTRREVRLEGIAGIIAADAPLNMITISDPESGMTYFVDTDKELRMLRTAPGSDRVTNVPPRPPRGRGSASQPRPTANVERQEALGSREIEGIPTEGTRTTVTIPAGTIGNDRAIESITERWFSPALRILVLSIRRDPRFGEATYRLTNISRAEPAAALFERPQ